MHVHTCTHTLLYNLEETSADNYQNNTASYTREEKRYERKEVFERRYVRKSPMGTATKDEGGSKRKPLNLIQYLLNTYYACGPLQISQFPETSCYLCLGLATCLELNES